MTTHKAIHQLEPRRLSRAFALMRADGYTTKDIEMIRRHHGNNDLMNKSIIEIYYDNAADATQIGGLQ